MRLFHIKKGTLAFSQWLKHLFSQPVFIFVTLWGHLAIFCGALGFYHFENGINEKANTFLNSYYWAICVATTVGSDIAPITVGGKLTAIAMMITGALFLWSYTALFAASLVASDMRKVEAEVEEIETDIKLDKISLIKLRQEMEQLRRLLEKHDENSRI